MDFNFHEYLRHFYINNKGKIRRNYKDLTKKFLDFNNKETNPDAFLWKPQFEALEMYVFLKEFLGNGPIHQLFDEWREKEGYFSDDSYYSLVGFNSTGQGQINMYDIRGEEIQDYYKRLQEVSMDYPNYIYALTMGLGKTILMATCIYYEFLLANKFPKDNRYCHNALVFAPDKTVLESLREIMTFDKSKVVPQEYVNVLDSNIKFHYLEDTETTLSTIDGSDFNIIITNNQKIIVKRKRKEDSATDKFFNMKSYVTSSIFGDSLKEVYGDDAIGSEKDLIINQRFIKLCRLPQLGVYVDEAHHLYGNKLDKALYDKSKKTSLRSTINLLSVELDRNDTKLVACYNYTGTPYVKNKVLPEVVYSYGLAESISNGYLKKAERLGFENVKSEDFLRAVIKDFWDKYGGKTYEGLAPKLAIFSSTHKELLEEVYPVVEEVLENLDISRTKILVNIGDTKRTKAEDIRDFNNLDVPDTAGAEKQFILLVDKGREGWDCRSLFGVALYRKPKSRIFVLQATMRCLRKITDIQQEATIYLSKENMDILEKELQQNYRASLDDLKGKKSDKKSFEVRVVPPKRYINLKVLKHKYYLEEKKKSDYIDFELDTLNVEKYQSNIYRQYSMTLELTTKKENVDHLQEKKRYSELTLTAELSRYLNLSCININKILHDSVDGIEKVIEYVNKYNEILYDVIVHKIFNSFFKVKYEIVSEDRDVLLLREPKDKEYYSFSAKPELVKRNTDSDMKEFADKAFHADTYCFDSKPEKELFLQYLVSDEVEEVYFTGMFTGNQGDLHIQYYDPESQRIRNYYPDFYVKMKDGSSQIVEVKADHMIDNDVVMAKTDAANELVCESNMDYKIYPSSTVIESNVLDSNKESKDKQIHFDV